MKKNCVVQTRLGLTLCSIFEVVLVNPNLANYLCGQIQSVTQTHEGKKQSVKIGLIIFFLKKVFFRMLKILNFT